MLFPTYEFLGFFFLVFGIGIFLKQQVTAYKYFLVLASLVFYSFWSLKFLSLLVIDTIINYIILQSITRSQHKNFFFTLGLVINLLYLVFFKYENFFVDSLFEFLHLIHLQSHFQVLQIIAPVGISFYTFRIIAHLVDCYKNQLDCPPLLDYAVYVTYFPQIASGPIARAQEFYVQLNSREKYNYKIEYVIILIISGLFKKYTLSSFLFNFTQLPFSLPEQYSSFDLILAAVAYSCLIYVDFSGYSDLANAISSLLGFKPIPNFNMPYRSLSVQEFWRRWHISLSEWLRDYLYIPLGGNRKGQLRKYLNLMLTMVIGGFWHGAGVNFLIWGGLHGVGLIINHLWKDLGKIISAKNTIREEKEKNFSFREDKKNVFAELDGHSLRKSLENPHIYF
ncbi:MBOAT family O-acyltransferase [Brasilonema sp. UFV-L1]|uniref:MBOAT family O-acyltransferase n=1 Tax=Brasilonema sp. UFV-L1 TaxID=2234130 RepID=UPI00145D3F4B|nr:MBOAT family O-acyltransferase [Brasilonema sp. UFV-L1]NMG07538.1 MBOAT family protein [Brasilonema sp. UFV-L1]